MKIPGAGAIGAGAAGAAFDMFACIMALNAFALDDASGAGPSAEGFSAEPKGLKISGAGAWGAFDGAARNADAAGDIGDSLAGLGEEAGLKGPVCAGSTAASFSAFAGLAGLDGLKGPEATAGSDFAAGSSFAGAVVWNAEAS